MTSQTPPPASGPQAPPPPPPPTDPQPVPPGGPGVAQFFDRIRAFGAVRPDDGRWAAGVAAGLARRWGVDPLLVRGGFVVLALFGGIGLLLYGLGWLFLPHPDGRIHAQEVLRGTVTAGFVGGLLAVLADLGGSGWRHDGWYGPQPFGSGFVVLGLVALAIWWFGTGRHRGAGGPGGPGGPGTPWTPTTPPPAGGGTDRPADGASSVPTAAAGPSDEFPATGSGGTATGPVLSTSGIPAYGTPGYPTPLYASSAYGGGTVVAPAAPRPDLTRPSRAWTRVVLGVALLVAGAVLLVDRIGGSDPDGGVVATAAALGVLALGVLVAWLRGRRAGGLAPIGIVLAVVTLGLTATSEGSVTWAGTRTWTPEPVAGQMKYGLGIGDATLDLSRLATTSSQDPATVPRIEIEAKVGLGELTVVVPEDVDARIVAESGTDDVSNKANLPRTPTPFQSIFGSLGPVDSKSTDIDVVSGDGNPTVLVRAEIGGGQITIVRSR